MTAAHESTITPTRVGVWARCTCGWEETIRVDTGSPSKAGAAAFMAHLETTTTEEPAVRTPQRGETHRRHDGRP